MFDAINHSVQHIIFFQRLGLEFAICIDFCRIVWFTKGDVSIVNIDYSYFLWMYSFSTYLTKENMISLELWWRIIIQEYSARLFVLWFVRVL